MPGMKPALDSRGRNIVTGSARHDGNTVWLDHEEADPQRRFKIAEVRCCEAGCDQPHCDFRHYTLLASPDGLNWTQVVRRSGVTADRATVWQDRHRGGRWVYSIKTDPCGVPTFEWIRIAVEAASHWCTPCPPMHEVSYYNAHVHPLLSTVSAYAAPARCPQQMVPI